MLKEREHGAVIVTRNGRPVAALLAVTDDQELERMILAHSPRLRAVLETARQQIREGEGIRHEDFWREMDEEKPRKRGGAKRKAAPLSR
jgi:PHD/YefM family antitoxin component YafN of YafNO toxin-antitoxin module